MITKSANIPSISAKSWNEIIDVVSSRLPMRFVDVGNGWRHPWHVEPEWKRNNLENDDGAGEWVFRIKPGFVNGVDPDVVTRAELCQPRTLDRMEGETGKRPAKKEPVEALVTESPEIPLGATRLIGDGAGMTSFDVSASGAIASGFEAVPEFFRSRGVKTQSVKFGGNLNTGIVEIATPEEDGPKSILRACDVVLTVDRLRAIVEVYPGIAALDGFSAWLYVRYGRNSPPRERPRLQVMDRYTPRIDVDAGGIMLDAIDPEEDQLKIATIYLLSPAGWNASLPPDGRWNAYVQHSVFWNLNHAAAEIPDPPPMMPLTMRTGLIAGIGDAIGNTILAGLNDAWSQALEQSRSVSMRGRFWTL